MLLPSKNGSKDFANYAEENSMTYKRSKLKELFIRWCAFLRNGNSRTVYEEALPILNDYSRKNRRIPEAIQAIMAACALLDAFHAGVKLEGSSPCQLIDELMEGLAV
jgi:hypothetical protein